MMEGSHDTCMRRCRSGGSSFDDQFEPFLSSPFPSPPTFSSPRCSPFPQIRYCRLLDGPHFMGTRARRFARRLGMCRTHSGTQLISRSIYSTARRGNETVTAPKAEIVSSNRPHHEPT